MKEEGKDRRIKKLVWMTWRVNIGAGTLTCICRFQIQWVFCNFMVLSMKAIKWQVRDTLGKCCLAAVWLSPVCSSPLRHRCGGQGGDADPLSKNLCVRKTSQIFISVQRRMVKQRMGRIPTLKRPLPWPSAVTQSLAEWKFALALINSSFCALDKLVLICLFIFLSVSEQWFRSHQGFSLCQML